MQKNKKNQDTSESITHVPILKSTKPVPDGSFIQSNDMDDGFAAINTSRYGEEIDVDDM